MSRTRTLLVSTSAELEREVRAAAFGEVDVYPIWPLPSQPADVLARTGGALPSVVLLDPGVAVEQALALASRFEDQYPGISVVLVSDRGAQIGIEAMRAGVRDILHPAADSYEIREVLERAAAATAARLAGRPMPEVVVVSAPAAPVRRGRVIAVTSPKGGVGKTTVATNLAVGIARQYPDETVIVDIDVQFGDVASGLNLAPEYALPDAVAAARDPLVLKTYLTRHAPTGLYAICGASSPAAADMVTGEGIGDLVDTLATEFRYVIVDTAPGLTEHTLAALDRCNDVVLVTSMDVPGVRGLRKELDTLNELGMFPTSRHLVLNMVDPSGGLSVADVEATIHAKIDVQLPRSRAVPISVNQGVPVMQTLVKDTVVRGLQDLVYRFVPQPEPTGRWRARGKHRSGRRRA